MAQVYVRETLGVAGMAACHPEPSVCPSAAMTPSAEPADADADLSPSKIYYVELCARFQNARAVLIGMAVSQVSA